MPLINAKFLFLDRDGVINKRIENDYIRDWESFEFIEGSLVAVCELSKLFDRTFIVTNQRGVGLGLMSDADLNKIHEELAANIKLNSGRLDAIYSCIDRDQDSLCRKPNTGMALQAKLDFPEVDFKSSIIVGDSSSDMAFGRRLGMLTAFIGQVDDLGEMEVDFVSPSLFKFYNECYLKLND